MITALSVYFYRRLTCASQEPLLDPDYVEAGCYAPSAAAAVRRSSTTKSSGFKFTLPVRSSSRAVLSKRREDQPRRNTVASIIADKESQANSVWPHVDARPRSSQSTLPGELTAPDEPSSESIFSRESAALGAPSPSQGGLFPRPASLQRHWSDVGSAAQQQQQQQQKPDVSTPDPKPLLAPERVSQLRSNDPDRIRPLSFGGLSNGFGTLRITEAAALESRVKELETHVADLRSIIADAANWPPSRQQQQPFDGSALSSHLGAFNRSPGQSFSRLDSDTAVAPEDSPLLYDQLSPRGSLGRDRERALSVLEGLHLDPDNKRNTLSTIRGPRRGSMRSVSENSPQSHLPPPGMPEYSGIVAMVKREQKARRRLEQQVAALQEQMAAVLHRQLVDQTSRSQSALDNPSPSRRTHDFSISPVHRKASSSEIPTPDVTPPSSSAAAAAARQSANLNLFMSFDGSGRAASDGDDDDHHHHHHHHHHHPPHHDSDFYKPASESDAWKTPAEEKGNLMERTDSTSTFGDALMAFPPPAGAGRTLSLSQLTQSSSLVPQRV